MDLFSNAMAQDQTAIIKQQKEAVRKKRRQGIRSLLTGTLFLFGGTLMLGIIFGTFLEHGAFSSFAEYKGKIHEFVTFVFTACVGLLCLVLAFERAFDFDTIESTLEKQNQTLRSQNSYFESSATTLNNLSTAIDASSVESRNLILKTDELISKIKPPTVIKDINWKHLIKQADQIDFLVQGWDGWMDHHYTELKDFFERKGKFNLFVVNADGEGAKYVRQLMETRLGKSTSLVEAEIAGTIDNIHKIFDEADDPDSKKSLEVFCLNEINWYFAAQFKSVGTDRRDVLVLSLYSHHRYPIKETPAIVLFRDTAPDVFKWFDAELKYLQDHSSNLILNNSKNK